jgi:cell division transport system permease protein
LRKLGASLRFSLLAAGQNFTRNFGVSIAGVFTMGLILFLVGGVFMGTHSVNAILEHQKSEASKIRLYLQDSVSLKTIANYQQEIGHDPRVKDITFVTKDQAIAASEQRGLDFQQALQALGSNPLPASLELDVKQLSDLAALNDEAKGIPVVDNAKGHGTDYNQDVIPNLQRAIFWIELIGVILGLILGAISLVIIMNTIRTAVYIRRTEIEIMKLVGATDWFVRWPFILEGMLGGILAAIFGGAVVAVLYQMLLKQANASFLGIAYDGGFLIVVLLLLALAGSALGAFGSYLGVRRFLNV